MNATNAIELDPIDAPGPAEDSSPLPETHPAPIRRKRPAPEGARTLTHQLRGLVKLVCEREEITPYEFARRASVDPKLLGRFLAGTPGRGLSLATADRIALAFGLRLVEGVGRPAAKSTTKASQRYRP